MKLFLDIWLIVYILSLTQSWISAHDRLAVMRGMPRQEQVLVTAQKKRRVTSGRQCWKVLLWPPGEPGRTSGTQQLPKRNYIWRKLGLRPLTGMETNLSGYTKSSGKNGNGGVITRNLVHKLRNMLLWLQGLGSVPAAVGELWSCPLCAKFTSLLWREAVSRYAASYGWLAVFEFPMASGEAHDFVFFRVCCLSKWQADYLYLWWLVTYRYELSI